MGEVALELMAQRFTLPIWVFRYSYKGEDRRAVMNGQTGAIHGDRPVSALKVALAIAIPLFIAGAIALVWFLQQR